ncbi:MAG: hypothetical protein R6V18_09980 [Desulfuromonadaceae bacterium]
MSPILWKLSAKISASIHVRAVAHLFALVLIVLSGFPTPVQGLEVESACTLQQGSAPQSERVATNPQKTPGTQSESEPQGFDSPTLFPRYTCFGTDSLSFPTLYLSSHASLQGHTHLCPRAPPV